MKDWVDETGQASGRPRTGESPMRNPWLNGFVWGWCTAMAGVGLTLLAAATVG